MAKLHDVERSEFEALKRAVYEMRFAAPQNASAIGAGGLRVYGGGMITIENGGFKVTGTAEIIGSLLASGTITFNGPVNITGPLDVSGLTKLMADLTVLSGGRIVAGSIELKPDGSAKFGSMTISPAGVLDTGNVLIDPSASNGGFTFKSGGGVGGNAGTVVVKGIADAGLITGIDASIFAGPNSVTVTPSGTTVAGPLSAGLTSTPNAANVYFDPVSKRLYYKP